MDNFSLISTIKDEFFISNFLYYCKLLVDSLKHKSLPEEIFDNCYYTVINYFFNNLKVSSVQLQTIVIFIVNCRF